MVRAETPAGQPQSGVAVYVSNISPPGVPVTCYPGLTGSDGMATIFCETGVPQQDRDLEITVTDSLGRSAPPVRIRLLIPQKVEGLSKVSGDGETVRSNDMIDLVVVAVKDRLLQPGLALTITRTEGGVVFGGDAATQGVGIVTDARMKATYDMLVAMKLLDPAKVDLARTYTTEFVRTLKVMP